MRCTCHDFDFWAHLWKRSPAVVKRLRLCCHAATCKLYSPLQNVDCAFDFLQTPGALCCPSSGRSVRIHDIMLQKLRRGARDLGALPPMDPLGDPKEFPPEGQEDDETDDDGHSHAHWVEKDQKCVASESMRNNRSLCKQNSSVNWCECDSLDECYDTLRHCRAWDLTSSECICQPSLGILRNLQDAGLTPAEIEEMYGCKKHNPTPPIDVFHAHQMPDPCFESLGRLACCKNCHGPIVVGLLH